MSAQIIYPSAVRGELKVPSSKSMAQRALVAAMLAEGESVIDGFTPGSDALAALSVVRRLVTSVHQQDGMIRVQGSVKVEPTQLFCGESGLLARLLVPISAAKGWQVVLTGEGSLLNRPFGFVADTLKNMGVRCATSGGFLPLQVEGVLQGGSYEVDGSPSSQLVSGLLMALPLCTNDSVLKVSSLASQPYVAMTLALLRDFGIHIESEDYKLFAIKGQQKYIPCSYTVEGDWSAASNFLVAAAVGGSVTLTGLNTPSLQADRAIVDVLKLCGAKISVSTNAIMVEKNELVPFEFDATHSPDLFPPLATLAASCKGTSKIKGVGRLAHKESNRAATLQQEFGRLGVVIELVDDYMLVHGSTAHGGTVYAHNDHRIAMALAVTALNADGAVTINGVESVEKSYPLFFNDLRSTIIT